MEVGSYRGEVGWGRGKSERVGKGVIRRIGSGVIFYYLFGL